MTDEAQKIFVVREMVPKDITREFLTGLRKIDENMEKLEIMTNEMADSGPILMDLGMWVEMTRRRLRATRTRAMTRHTKTGAPSPGKGTKPAKEPAKRVQMDREHDIVEREPMYGRVAGEMTEPRKEARRAPKAASLNGTVTRTREAMEVQGKVRATVWTRAKPDTAMTAASTGISELLVHKKMTRSHRGRVCLKEKKTEELASLGTPDDEGEWCWPRRNRITRWSRRIDPQLALHYLAEDDEGEQASGGLNHMLSRNARGDQWT